MFGWITKLFGARADAAAERAEQALVEIADLLEGARDQLRLRLQGPPAEPRPLEVEPPANGKRKLTAK